MLAFAAGLRGYPRRVAGYGGANRFGGRGDVAARAGVRSAGPFGPCHKDISTKSPGYIKDHCEKPISAYSERDNIVGRSGQFAPPWVSRPAARHAFVRRLILTISFEMALAMPVEL